MQIFIIAKGQAIHCHSMTVYIKSVLEHHMEVSSAVCYYKMEYDLGITVFPR
jgi:hypothetical protein